MWEEIKQTITSFLDSLSEKIISIEENIATLVKRVNALDVRVAKLEESQPEPTPPEPNPEPIPITVPEDHQKIADKVKCYYPWMVLEKKCVFVGIESEKLLETCWLWIFKDDKGNSDVACVMTIINWGTYYSLEFSRVDGLDGEKLIVEVEGYGKYDSIFNRTDAQKGYWGLSVNA